MDNVQHSFTLEWELLEKRKSLNKVMSGCVYETGDDMLAGLHAMHLKIRQEKRSAGSWSQQMRVSC